MTIIKRVPIQADARTQRTALANVCLNHKGEFILLRKYKMNIKFIA